MNRDTQPLHGARNIGATIAARLAAIGIHTIGDLRRITPARAYQMLQQQHPGQHLPLCYYLYSLQGALDNSDWRKLTPACKAQLKSAAGIPQNNKNMKNNDFLSP